MRLEHWFYTIPLRLRSVFRRSRMERELEKELQLHLTQRIEQGVAMGQPADEARYAALRAMEGIEQRKEECRDARRVHWLEDLLQDVCYAFRILAKAPGFTVVAALVLALGIGANTAVFTVVNGVLLQPLPFSEPSRLFLISAMPKNNPFIAPGPYMSDRDYLRFRRQDHAFESTATFGKEPVTLTGAGDPAVMNALAVTPDFFKVLGVRPALGRAFLPKGQVDTNVTLLSDRLWHGRFGGDPTIVGKAITLDGISYAIAGVMPASFTFQEAELWKRMEVKLDLHNSFMRPVIGRLKPGVSPQQAQAELQALAAVRPLDEGEKRDNFVTRITPLQELFVADVRKLLLVFVGAVAVVLVQGAGMVTFGVVVSPIVEVPGQALPTPRALQQVEQDAAFRGIAPRERRFTGGNDLGVDDLGRLLVGLHGFGSLQITHDVERVFPLGLEREVKATTLPAVLTLLAVILLPVDDPFVAADIPVPGAC